MPRECLVNARMSEGKRCIGEAGSGAGPDAGDAAVAPATDDVTWKEAERDTAEVDVVDVVDADAADAADVDVSVSAVEGNTRCGTGVPDDAVVNGENGDADPSITRMLGCAVVGTLIRMAVGDAVRVCTCVGMFARGVCTSRGVVLV